MNNTRAGLSVISSIICLCAIVTLGSCGTKEQKPESKGSFVLNDSVAKIITIDTVKTHELEGNLELNGQVTFNDNTVVRVMPLVTGTVETVKVQLGEYVTQGQVIATIRSSELAGLQNDLNAATANFSVAKKNLEVVKELEQKGVNSQKEVVEAQQEVNKGESEVNSISKKISNIGGSTSGNEVAIKSPVNGYIVERKINPNQVVDENNNDPLFTVSDMKEVWVMASVYETDIEKVKLGADVKISTIAYPDKEFKGTINYISNVLDPENKTLKVRVVLNNPGNELKPEMFAKVILSYKEKKLVPSISKDAVVFDDSKTFAVVYKSRDSVSVRRIELYPTRKEILYVKSGLRPGEMIISKNQLIVYNALTSL